MVIGVDLREYENRYFEQVKMLDKWKLKSYKEQTMKELSRFIVNIKKKDLEAIGQNPQTSEIFGIQYIAYLNGIYSRLSGFIIEAEKDAKSCFD